MMVILLFNLSFGINWYLPIYGLDIQHKDGFSINIDYLINKRVIYYGFSLDAGSFTGRYRSNYCMSFFSPMVELKLRLFNYFPFVMKGGSAYIERRNGKSEEKGFVITSVSTLGFEKDLKGVPFTIYTGIKNFYDRKIGVVWLIGTGFSF